MTSHFYLLRKTIKNHIREIFRKPGKLVLYLLVTLALAAALLASLFGSKQAEPSFAVSYLQGIFFAFLMMFYVLSIQKGLSAGDAIFGMNDVNLLFVSPVNPRATLLYGLIRLAAMSFWAGFFLLFQSGTLSHFGVGFSGVLILFTVFMLNMITLTLLSLVIYSVSNGNPRRRLLVKVLATVVFMPLAAFFATRAMALGDMTAALYAVIESPVLAATPFVGWASAGAIALIKGQLLAGAGWLGLLALSAVGMLLYIMFSHADYYEDVLVATETAFEKKRAVAEGNVQLSGSTSAKIKVAKTGLGGAGVRVFLYKHLRETFRKNRFGFLSLYIIITAICIAAASLLILDETGIITVLQVLMWIQVFMIGTGRGLLETYSHYIYMIPGSPLQKLLWSNMELVLRTAVESMLFLGIPGVVLGSNVAVIVGCMAVYTLFSLMLISINYLSLRFTEANISQGILLTVYFAMVMLLIAPGLVAALIIGFQVGGLLGTLLGLLILSVWELIVALACFALSRNVLHNCDMPTMKAK